MERLAMVGHDKLLRSLVCVTPSTGTITKIRQESYREIQSVAITVAVNRRRSSCGLEQTDLSGEVWSEWQDLNVGAV
jgi:Na+-transporting NADH:ubiquinone oxidoreductase subunit NqrA